MKNRPFQARVWFQGRYWSLGYYASITEAEIKVNRVYREMAEWKEMQLPPPTLLRQIQQRASAPAASQQDQTPLASGTAVADPELLPQQ
jgi:hypothetical protein